jgi:hypothetical protein
MDEVQFLFWILMLAVGGATFGYAVLQPFIAATRKRSQGVHTVQFLMSDLLWLALLTHLPLVFLAAARHWQDGSIVAVLGGLLMAMVLYLWFRGVTLLSKIGVEQPLRRGVFLVLVLPVAVLGSLLVGFPVLLLLAFLFSPPDRTYVTLAVLSGLSLVLLLACYGGRRLARWVVAGATGAPPALTDSPPPAQPEPLT